MIENRFLKLRLTLTSPPPFNNAGILPSFIPTPPLIEHAPNLPLLPLLLNPLMCSHSVQQLPRPARCCRPRRQRFIVERSGPLLLEEAGDLRPDLAGYL